MSLTKGSPAALLAGKNAKATRAANKALKEKALSPFKRNVVEFSSKMVLDKQAKNSVSVSLTKKTATIRVEKLDLKKLNENEAYVMFTDGPTKIVYSSQYRTLRITPHHVILNGIKKQ